jgi:hypothetical protein
MEDNTKTDLTDTRSKSAQLILAAQDGVPWRAFVNTVMNFRIPYKTGNALSS